MPELDVSGQREGVTRGIRSAISHRCSQGRLCLPVNPPGDLPENVADRVTAYGAGLTPEDVEPALEAVERVAGEKS